MLPARRLGSSTPNERKTMTIQEKIRRIVARRCVLLDLMERQDLIQDLLALFDEEKANDGK
jgi:hypothetical protein